MPYFGCCAPGRLGEICRRIVEIGRTRIVVFVGGATRVCGRHKRGLRPKLYLAVNAHGLPVRALITAGPAADCTQAEQLIEVLDAAYLLADRGDDSDAIVAQAEAQGMTPVMPPKRNRKIQRAYDKDLYKLRHLVENAFLPLQRWRGIATHYTKNITSFLAAVHIRCLLLWLNIS